MTRALAMSLLLLGACDNVFRIIRVDERVDGNTGDGITADGPVDAAKQGCALNFISPGDFDTDGIANDVDLCPALTSPQSDYDGDGLGDMCDPHMMTPGDCILLMDTFDNLDCWHSYEPWNGCNAEPMRPCSTVAVSTLDLLTPLGMTSAELRGTVVNVQGTMPNVGLMMDDSQLGAGITGHRCAIARDPNGYIESLSTLYSNGTPVSNMPQTNSPTQMMDMVPFSAVIVWQPQQAVTPYVDACETYTASTTVPISMGRIYSTSNPAGPNAVIRSADMVFRPTAFIAYGACSDN
ncbi:MAG TPA: hypothetical protein VMZ53_04680 [Kofleriaceae bacterium]|nr:hypothetical protein [Kofleriaceae bacterium]